jgi:transposase
VRKAKPNRRKYDAEFKRKALEEMSRCDSVVGLAKQLGIHWVLLYKWKRAAEAAAAQAQADSSEQRQAQMQAEIDRLKSALADKVLEVDFFKGALQRIETRRCSASSGERPSTTKSGR